MAKIFTPKNNKWIAGISSILLGASQISTPIDLKGMIPEFLMSPFIMSIIAFGAVIGGVLVLMSRTE